MKFDAKIQMNNIGSSINITFDAERCYIVGKN